MSTYDKPRRTWPWIVGPFSALILYVLSLGPATWVISKRGELDVVWLLYAITYLPLFGIAEKSVVVRSLLGWYVGLWTDDLPAGLSS